MDPRKMYPPETNPSTEKRAKSKTAPAPIVDDRRFAAAATILRTLENGLGEIEREIDALRIEDHLKRRPNDPRAAIMKDRARKHRSASRKKPEPEQGNLPPAIAEALEIIRGSRPPTRVSHQKMIEQLEKDRDVIRVAIFEQTTAVDAIRDELSAALATSLVSKHRQLILNIFRSAQALAAASDAEREFRNELVDAGYTWRGDLLRGPQLRAALVLGSESTFESDISRCRRALEELKIV